MAKHYAWCNNTECDNKEVCLRYSEDTDIMYVNFKALLVNDKCPFLMKPKEEIAVEDKKTDV